jgi:1-acyl-sn-glycerol-3-phosphate acyltransferase
MKFLKNIFGRLWAFWGLVSFITTFLIIFLPSMVSYLFKDEKKGQDYFIAVSRVWMSAWLWMIGCPVKVYGKENFAPGETYVIVYNHNAFLDVPLSAPFVPGGNKTIAKDSFAKVPIFNFFYKRGSVLVNRKSEKSRIKSFEAMKEVLNKGMHMCIYPEGTRNRTAQPMKQFYDGAFKLASAAEKDVLPCVITGTRKAMPIHKTFFLFPTPLKMYFLQPVSFANKESKILKDEVYKTMVEFYEQKYK